MSNGASGALLSLSEPIRPVPDKLAIALVDVQYEEEQARAACVVAGHWTDSKACEEVVVEVRDVKPYRSGRFFERELPCLVRVIELVQRVPSVIVVDGYVTLDETGTAGLGAHLYEHYRGTIPVIGIAKRAYHGSAFATAVRRGSSEQPLFVTARGVRVDDAAQRVREMHGEHRTPTLAKRVDQLARGLVTPKPRVR